ncbi:histidine kinase/DNA gyrase B/HSP90-like ATPase [Pseudonocardia hierapolitana]|uniref:Histidine kinase/DNA gyrase B/HSP90-like ATPase n=1 Tax=Pseudonocardia hierapolitana TaxID=1128676 RepID=A0A561SW41_9PSEU|nr:ATP-binding protein [Pseudonocardia hierapolitana]TWF79078.1 histidine kinase/DNA gyrase B/HSP90-like ATPase [Pseudonocardia hierapolitana]
MTAVARRVLAVAAFWALVVACAVLSLLSLAAGAVGWAASREPLIGWLGLQGVLDYGLSVLALVAAGVLVAGRDKSWSSRLLLLAMVASAGAFNVQAIAVVMVVDVATGLQIGLFHQELLPAIAVAAYVLALLVFPPEREPGAVRSARTALVLAGAGALLLAGFGSVLLSPIVSCVLFFGFLGPVVGVMVLPSQIRTAPTATARTQARLLFSVVAVASAIAIVLAVITILMWTTGWGSLLLLADPTAEASGEPTALLFWFSRLASIAIAGAVFVATRPGGLWNAERLFSRGLAAGLTAALIGGGYCLVRTSTAGLLLEDGVLLSAVLATVLAAVTLRPAYVRVERWTDRLLFGTRPTPYSVLAGVTALSRVTATDAPDLARVAEAVGRGLGAATCRLTVTRPGLRDRSYTWAEGEARDPDELVQVVVRHGTEAIGTLAVDYAAVAGLQEQRQHLLEDVADSLGAVLQASRYGIELERQLRAALAHASEIAASRRAVVAEMDGERRRIERDLHDGAQHHLVSLRLALGLVEHQVSTAQFGKARARLEQVSDQIDVAESILAETAMGVSAPLLAELGLLRALEKELAGGEPPVAVDASGVAGDGRFSHDVESAVYFSCLEAVNNARKHAQGATIGVRLYTEDGHLRFVVQDDGPGWDQSRATGSPGRGLRNVTTRISTVGGRIDVRSAPGQGTTVDGSVPLPQPSATSTGGPSPVAAAAGNRPAAPDVAAEATHPLIDQVRDAVREARDRYRSTPRADAVGVLAERLDAPLRIGVSGDGAASVALRQALAALGPDGTPGDAALIDVAVPAGRPAPHADAFVVLLRRDAGGNVLLPDQPFGTAWHRSAHAIGALLVDGPVDEAAQRVAVACAAGPEVRQLCHVVVPVAPAFARAGERLSDEQFRILQVRAEGGSADGGFDDDIAEPLGEAATVPVAAVGSGPIRADGRRAVPAGRGAGAPAFVVPAADVPERERPVPFERAAVRFAVTEIRSGRAPTREALAAALEQGSGLPRLRELMAERLTRRADAVKSRGVLLALEDLVRHEPPPVGGDGLRYRLDRIRSRAFELTELDVVDAVRAGELDLPDSERRAVERLLGAAGADPRTRLGLAPDAAQQEVAHAAAEQLASWQRRAANPLTGVELRKAAAVLVQTCERLIVGSDHFRTGPVRKGP